MKTRSLLAALAAGAALLAACGSDSSSSSSTAAAASPAATSPAASETTAAAPETTAAASGGAAPVTVANTALGAILADASGRTVYGFTKDTAGTPTCVDGCADAWPPVLVKSEDLPAGLDAAVFKVVERPDGTYQLKAGDWPLYLFSGDSAPAQTNGQGSNGVWFVVGADGQLIKG